MNEELEKGILKGVITGEFEMTEENETRYRKIFR